jgi:NADH-quinone oxidoreductase subunit L
MMLACGVGAFVAAIFHVMTHAFFKALLFLGSGSVIHGMHHEQDMRRMGGLKKYLPITFATMVTGWLAICGIIPFAGFFSKDEILWKTWSTNVQGFPAGTGKLLWAIGALTALLTAVYMTRLMVMTFWGEERFKQVHAGGQADEAHAHAYDEHEAPHDARRGSAGDRAHHEPDEHVVADDAHGEHAAVQQGSHDAHDADEMDAMDDELDVDEAHDAHSHHGPFVPHESPWTMTVPLIVLAILSTFGGLLGVPYALSSLTGGHPENYFEHTLEPAVAHMPGGHEGAAVGDHEATGDVELLSPKPQPTDGAAPYSVGEGSQHEPAAERVPTAGEMSAERLFTLISLAIAVLGIVIGWVMFAARPLLKMPRMLEQKYYVDEIYNAALIKPLEAVSREGLWKLFDVGVIDGIVNGMGRGISEIGAVVRYLQIGFVRSYAALILLGALAVVAFFAYYGLQTFSR